MRIGEKLDSACWTPDGQHLIAAADLRREIQVHDASSGQFARALPRNTSLPLASFATTARQLDVVLMDGTIGAFAHMFAPEGRFLRVILAPEMTQDAVMEIIVPEAALKSGLLAFSRTLLLISLAVSLVVGVLIYFAIYRLVVRPMRRLTDSIVAFSEAPEGAEIAPMPGESDEMQRANSALQSMQRTVSAAQVSTAARASSMRRRWASSPFSTPMSPPARITPDAKTISPAGVR